MRRILVIVGPTATGKTDLALSLAKKFNGELVAADSRQVYRGLDIGTGKLPADPTYEVRRTEPRRSTWEIGGIRIWMYDVVGLDKQYTVADYVEDAERVIREIRKRGKSPVVVGGTGLYIKALLEGLDNLTVPMDKKLRKELEGLDLEQLQFRLKQVSPKRWESLNQSDRQNPRRLIRAIELEVSPRRSPFGHLRGVNESYDVLKIGLIAPRDVLYKRVDDGVLVWFKQGIIKEVEKLIKSGVSLDRLRQLGLEYASLADFLEGEIREIEGEKGLIKIMQGKIHGYIRRQLTWFKKERNVCWFDITTTDYDKKVEKLILDWYNKQ